MTTAAVTRIAAGATTAPITTTITTHAEDVKHTQTPDESLPTRHNQPTSIASIASRAAGVDLPAAIPHGAIAFNVTVVDRAAARAVVLAHVVVPDTAELTMTVATMAGKPPSRHSQSPSHARDQIPKAAKPADTCLA